MACYMSAKLPPLGLFGKNVLNQISSRPSTCLAATKSHELCDIWAPHMYQTDKEYTIPYDHTNRILSQFRSPKITNHRLNKHYLVCLNTNNDIEEMDKLQILNSLQSNTQLKNYGKRPKECVVPIQSPYYIYCLEKLNSTASDHKENLQYSSSAEEGKDSSQKPTPEQLEKIFIGLSESLPYFFVRTHNYHLYNPKIEFRNGIRGVETKGIQAYMQHIGMLKIMGHFRYAHVKFTVLKITKHEEDGTVRARWRVTGVSGIRALLTFKLFDWKKAQDSEWIDGFSIFHVGSDGLIYKHECDKMMPDENREAVRPGNVGLKLAMLIGLNPTGTTLGNFSMCTSSQDTN